ncbi:fimbrial protein [Enterobacter roggenkampii]|uniref:fimbrial protein n=1 Tax=Enterobacter roggenkampii TaxID=1812935 RepID=UPI003B438204
MRQVTRQSVLFFSVLLCVALPASAIDDGSVHFQGQVVNTGCSVSAESQDQIVRMGQIHNNEFAATGDWAAPTAFQITLGKVRISHQT